MALSYKKFLVSSSPMISRSRDSDHIHVWEIIGEELNNIMHTFGYHVHPHSTTSVTTEPYIGFFPAMYSVHF